MTRQVFNPLLESNFQKMGEMQATYTVYRRGNTIFADPAPGSGLGKYTGTDIGTVLTSCFTAMGSGQER